MDIQTLLPSLIIFAPTLGAIALVLMPKDNEDSLRYTALAVTAVTFLLTIALYHHAQLGLQVVIEDYVHHEAAKFAGLISVKLGAVFLAVYTIFCILRLTFGG